MSGEWHASFMMMSTTDQHSSQYPEADRLMDYKLIIKKDTYIKRSKKLKTYKEQSLPYKVQAFGIPEYHHLHGSASIKTCYCGM